MNILQKNFKKSINNFLGKNNAVFEFSGFLYENPKKKIIEEVGLTLDLSLESVKIALEYGVDTLVCFHAPDKLDKKEIVMSKIRKLIKGKLNLYKCHLPLNFADRVGVHAVLCDIAGFNAVPVTFNYEGHKIKGGEYRILGEYTLDELLKKLKKVGSPYARIFNHVNDNIMYKNILFSSGSGFKKELFDQTNCDLIISGEVKHGVIIKARDSGVTLVELGHYYTECGPLNVVTKKMEDKIGINVRFIDVPFLEKMYDFK